MAKICLSDFHARFFVPMELSSSVAFLNTGSAFVSVMFWIFFAFFSWLRSFDSTKFYFSSVNSSFFFANDSIWTPIGFCLYSSTTTSTRIYFHKCLTHQNVNIMYERTRMNYGRSTFERFDKIARSKSNVYDTIAKGNCRQHFYL